MNAAPQAGPAIGFAGAMTAKPNLHRVLRIVRAAACHYELQGYGGRAFPAVAFSWIRYLQRVVNLCIIYQQCMAISVKLPILAQRKYYTETASRYALMHSCEAVDDAACLQILLPLLRALDVHSLLDVGSATGRGLPKFLQGLPDAFICGVEPVEALVRQGISSGVNQGLPLFLASGDALPFADKSFDAVCEFGILHHVPEPPLVIQEMLRVARNVVVISDANRFGQGPLSLRIIKLLLYKLKLWNVFDFVRTRGKRYQVSAGDGVFYSYSVYDNYQQIQQWAENIFLFPIGETRSWSWFHPLLNSNSVLLIAVRRKPASAT
jgi:SAM-dependent methyltransferase